MRAGYHDGKACAESLHIALSGLQEVRGSADVLDDDLLLVRTAAVSGVAFRRARHALIETLSSGAARQNL